MEASKPLDLNDIPRAWKHALMAVQLLYPSAIIAGGCLRDRDLGLKVKDIDIFIEDANTNNKPVQHYVDQFTKEGWQVQTNFDESYDNRRGIVAVLDAEYPGCPPVNLIVMTQVKLEEFDFGICQIQFDGKAVFRTKAYHQDKAARVFRIVPEMPDDEFVRSLERWARLKSKFPEGWKLNLGSRAQQGYHTGGTVTGRLGSSQPNIQVIAYGQKQP